MSLAKAIRDATGEGYEVRFDRMGKATHVTVCKPAFCGASSAVSDREYDAFAGDLETLLADAVKDCLERLRRSTMNQDVETMLNLAQVFGTSLEVSRAMDPSVVWVSIQHVWTKERRGDGVIVGMAGYGKTIEEACGDFLRKTRGKLLVGDIGFFGENRPEYLCL